MGFNSAYALWLLPLLGLIVLMYMLKVQHEELEISSLYLWKKAIAESEVKKPWQKLKNNILMIMQLLAAFMIIIALSDPFLTRGKALGGNIIIVIDRSGSMNAQDGDKTRLDKAKSMAEKAVREAGHASAFTVVSIDNAPRVEVSSTEDKEEAVKALRSLKGTNMAGSIKDDLSLIKAMYNQLKDANVLVYTDEPIPLEGMKGEVIALGGSGENVGIGHISYSQEGETYTALVRVENNGEGTAKREVALYTDDKLFELREVELSPGESKNVIFEGIKKGYGYLWAELTEKDALQEDNKAYLVLQNTEPKRVLLFFQKNIFVEKALSSIEGLEVYKTDDVSVSDDSYDLYIFDGMMPAKLPQRGSLFFINPGADNSYFEMGETIGAGRAEILNHNINQHINSSGFYIGRMKSVKKPYWADALISAGQNTAAGAGVFEGRKIAYTAFDMHDSDFPLNSAFPIFMYNMAAYLTDMEERGRGFYYSGETIPLDFTGDIEEAVIESPEGRRESISKELLSYGFNSTGEVGIYKLSYKNNEDEKERIFAVNFPAEEAVRAFDAEWKGEKNEGGAKEYYFAGTNLRTQIIIFVLILLAAEWMVYIRGN